jgi:NADH-quinone oxidoreductase subunit D
MSQTKKDLYTEDMIINMGPSHPVTHGTVKFLATLDGEKVVNLEVGIGYLHRGFEKMCENGTWEQAMPYTDRLNYVSPLINNVGYALAVEKLAGIDVTERCKFIRVIACELSRIADHLTNIAASAMEMGAMTAFLYFVEAREFIWDLIESFCGARVTTNYIRIGGLKNDLPEGFADKTKEAFRECRKFWDDVNKLLTKNRIFIDRVRNTGTMPADEAIAYGFTGPCLRASGVAYDVRKAHPYLVYDQLDFEIPVGETGDNFDRYLVRMEEINQSMRIVEQALEKIPEGPVNLNLPEYRRQPKEAVYNDIASLIHHFKTVIDGCKPPAGEIYFPIEAANGELGFYLVSDGTGKPYKCRVRPPCFPLTAAMPRMVKGGFIADIIPTFDLINMIGGECDR